MDEEKQEEKKEEPEVTTPDKDEGDKPTTTPLIDIANAAAERMEEANKETAKLIARQEELEQRKALGGRSDAGQVPEKPKELTDTEYAEALQRGEVNPLKEDGFIK